MLVVTSDRGLAGAYSSSVLKEAERLVEKLHGEGKEVDIYVSGRKGIGYYKLPPARDRGQLERLLRQPDLRGRPRDRGGLTEAMLAGQGGEREGDRR